MSWFVDASVIVAIVGREPDWELLADRLDEDEARLWSPIARWESIVASQKRLKATMDIAARKVDDVALLNGFMLVSIGAAEADAAIDAMRRYGKGGGHRARLNMGDCFAYACARTNGAALLYKGDDFTHTDLAFTHTDLA